VNARIALDLSRLLARAGRSAPTGIDRVELAYARHFIARGDAGLVFLARTPLGGFAPLPAQGAPNFVATLDAHWRGEITGSSLAMMLAAQKLLVSASLARSRIDDGDVVYLLVSHQHLDRPWPIARMKRRTGARFVPFVHDLIPLRFPEFARPGHAERHRRRIATVARFADAIIVNSQATRADLEPALGNRTPPPVIVAPLGIDPMPVRETSAVPARPYFICIGTIEPRKNHLLLLNLWRRLAAEHGENAPRLVLVGRRGWENENVVDLLQRSPPVRRLVDERGALPDRAMCEQLAGARALLMPSFAEGYGLPVAEALSVGTPVLCSDLGSLREVGQQVPEYLDPLDGPAWQRAIIDYSEPDSPRRRAQLDRLAVWRTPSWEAHFAIVDGLIERICGSTS
jgi:glycosyltransferase involved in cell wall biosynthesis